MFIYQGFVVSSVCYSRGQFTRTLGILLTKPDPTYCSVSESYRTFPLERRNRREKESERERERESKRERKSEIDSKIER